MATEKLNTVRAEPRTDVDDCPCVVIEIGQYRCVGGFDAHAWAELSPEDARDLIRNILAAARKIEARRAEWEFNNQPEPTEAQQGLIPIPDGYAEQ